MTTLKTKGFGYVFPDRNSWDLHILTQRPQWRERSLKQLFQDCGVNSIERWPSRSRVIPDRNSADFELVYWIVHRNENINIIIKTKRKLAMDFSSFHPFEMEKINNYALHEFHPEWKMRNVPNFGRPFSMSERISWALILCNTQTCVGMISSILYNILSDPLRMHGKESKDFLDTL
jgi:hypothetical protein